MTPKEQHPEHTRPAPNEKSQASPQIQLPTRGRDAYDVEGELARGGLGRVLRAKDQHLGRVVALKETLRDDNDIKERFLREALLTANLQHPSIVPIYEAGVWPSGEPFYSMKLISGKPLSDAVQEKSSLKDRLSLLSNLLAVCEAIAYAHSKNVIHRDLKPQNILLGEFGETVVIDWGLAKALTPTNTTSSINHNDTPQPRDTDLTQAGSIIGTPAYMPPEQARGLAVDERADVYSLGAILYFLLSGAPPYQGKLGNDVIERVITKPPMPLSEREANIPHDLLAIVQKAMSRELDLRYPSARELADDLKKYLNGQMVGAYQYSFTEQLRRWLSRYRAAVSVAAILLLVVICSLAYSFYRVNLALRSAEDAQALAERREAEALLQKKNADELRVAAEEQKQKTIEQSDELGFLTARNILEKNPRQALEILSNLSPNFKAHNAMRILIADALSRGDAKLLTGKTEEKFTLSPDKRFLVFAGESNSIRLWDLPCVLSRSGQACDAEHILTGPASELSLMQFVSVDEKPSLIAGYMNGELWLWDMSTSEGLPLAGHTKAVKGIACLSSGDTCYSTSLDGTVREWSLRTATGKILAEPNKELSALFLSADEKTLIWGSFDHRHTLHSLTTNSQQEQEHTLWNHSDDRQYTVFVDKENALSIVDNNSGATRTLKLHNAKVTRLAFSHNGKKLVSSDAAQRTFLIDLPTGKSTELAGHTQNIGDIVFSSNDEMLVTSQEGLIFFWDLATNKLIERRNDNQFPNMEFSSDNKFFAYPGLVNTVRLWSRDGSTVLLGHQNQVVCVSFSPSGRYLASSGYDGVVRVWDTQTPGASARWALYGHPEEVTQLAWLDEQTLISAGSGDKTVRVWPLKTQEGSTVEGLKPWMPLLSLSPDKTHVAFAAENVVQYCQVTQVLLCQTLPGEISRISSISFSPDGKKLLASSLEHKIRVWSLITQQSFLLEGHKTAVLTAVFSSDGDKIASVSEDNTLILWELSTRTPLKTTTREGPAPHLIVFSPGDSFLFSSGRDWWKGMNAPNEFGLGVLWIWNLTSGESNKILTNQQFVRDMILSPDKRDLLTSGEDMNVKVWSVECLTQPEVRCEPRVMKGHRGRVYQMRFSPSGEMLATAGDDNSMRLWDYHSGETLQVFRGHTHSVVSVDFSPDGLSLVSSGLDTTVRIWDIATAESRILRGHQDMVTQSFFANNGALVSVSFDGSVRLWSDSLPQDPTELREWLRTLL